MGPHTVPLESAVASAPWTLAIRTPGGMPRDGIVLEDGDPQVDHTQGKYQKHREDDRRLNHGGTAAKRYFSRSD